MYPKVMCEDPKWVHEICSNTCLNVLTNDFYTTSFMTIIVFYHVTQGFLLESYQRFGGITYPHFASNETSHLGTVLVRGINKYCKKQKNFNIMFITHNDTC